MNRYMKYLTTAVLAVALTLSLPFVLSAAGNAGTADDPLVTLSYINQTLKPEMTQQIHDQVYAELHKEIWTTLSEDLKAEILASVGIETPGTPTAKADYEVVMLEKGQMLNAKGACEIILSSGSALCYVTSQENIDAGVGLRDCTSGSEITNGNPVPLCHYVIIARGDGRGALVTSDIAYFMVRGAYEIV